MTAQPNSIGDLAGVLKHASDVLSRIAEIDKTVSDLQDEKMALLIEIGSTWGARVQDMGRQLQGFVQMTQSPVVQSNALLDFSRLDAAAQDLDNLNPDLPEGNS
jgi:NAD(P)H-dependent FMN reductase